MDNVQASVKILTIMEDSVNSRTGGGFPSPVEGIDNHALGFWYAAKVKFNSPKYDPNGEAKLAVTIYEREHRDKFFYKNGHQRRHFKIAELERAVDLILSEQ